MSTEVSENELNDDELSNLAKKAHRNASRRNRREEFQGDYDDLEEELDEDYDADEPELNLANFTKEQIVTYYSSRYDNTDNWDIFTDIGAELSNKSVFIKYQIRKSGKIFTHKDHPYSWEDLQREYGQGTYCVIAKTIDGKTITKQTQVLDTAPPESVRETNTANSGGVKTEKTGLELMEYMDRKIQQERESAKIESRERQNELLTMMTALKPDRSEDSSGVKELLPILTQMIQANNTPKEGNTDILLKMQEMNMNMFKEMNEKNERMMEKLQDKTERMLDALRSDSNHVDPNAIDQWKLLELLEKAKADGFDQMKMINEIAEQRALTLSDKPQESITDSVLKSLMPVVTTVMASKGNAGGYASMPNPNQQRGNLPQPTTNPQGRVAPRTPQTQGNPQAQTSRPSGAPSRQAVRPKARGVSSVLDTIQVEPVQKPKTAVVEPKTTVSEPIVESNENNAKIDLRNQERILQIAIPVVVDGFTNQGTPEDSVLKTIDAFNANRIDLTTVERDFTINEVEQLIVQYSLEGPLALQLREFYEKLIARIDWQNGKNPNS